MIVEILTLAKLLPKAKESPDGTLVLELLRSESYSLAYGELLPGQENKSHRLTSTESYFFLEGIGVMLIEEKLFEVRSHDLVTVPAHKSQKLINNGKTKLTFLMIVSPPYNPENEIIEEE